MKTCEITTSKGEFVVDEIDIDELAMCKFFNNPKMFRYGMHLQPLFLLSQTTEDDAKDVVDNHYWDSGEYYKDYIRICSIHRYCYTALESLHSLLKSKGIDINNGNWYLFKKLK